MSKSSSTSHQDPSKQLLGDYMITLQRFEGLEKLFSFYESKDFQSLGEKEKIEKVNFDLCALVQKTQGPCFLLAATVDFIHEIVSRKALESYSFSHFELWLNQFSQLSKEENLLIRGKIIGRFVPRDEYQSLFPIGMGKMYPGSHYVTAHSSPDLDTTVASFWGWVDAFGARVSEGLHIWNVPGGPPASQVEIDFLFTSIFGNHFFDHLIKTRSALTLSGIDLLTQKGLVKKKLEDSTLSIDHERNQNAVVVVDDAGYFLGDWRNFDVEGVRQVIMLLNSCLRWFETHLHVSLTSLFAKTTLSRDDLPAFSQHIFGQKMSDCEIVKEFSEKQKKYLHDFLQKVCRLDGGLLSSFKEFAFGMKAMGISAFQELIDLLFTLANSSLFDAEGMITESRSIIFSNLEKIIKGLEKAIQAIKDHVDTLGAALQIKKDVFGYQPQVVSYRAEVEEIRSKMATYPYLTVTSPDPQGRQIPLGVIHSIDVQKNLLGTVSLRDFCNREETKIPSYFEVISVIDHHKTSLSTLSVPFAMISDQQSSNSLVAEKAFEINDLFSLEGRDLALIDQQVKELEKDLSALSNKRLLQRLLQKQLIAAKKGVYFVDPRREFLEYLHCLYAILDDTDLLSKVSYRDLECIASLLNRMKSIVTGKESEIVSFDDIERGSDFTKKCAQRILQNDDMYSLYRKIYHRKEENVDHNLRLCVKGEPSTVFADTKVQNGCCRVGQTKMFAKNYPAYSQHADQVRALWYAEAKQYQKEKADVDLHIHMISTIPGAEDVYQGVEGGHSHKDELWIWIPKEEPAVEHLKSFLNAFKQQPLLATIDMEIEFLGDNAKDLDQIFKESFFSIPRKVKAEDKKISIPVAVLRYQSGALNSRKAMISPYLPKLPS